MRIFLGFLAALLLAVPAWGQTVPSYNQVPTCSAAGTVRAACGAVAGRNSIVRFNDSFADTLGGVIVGGGANEVLGWCEGTTCWNIGSDNGLLTPLFVENAIDADDLAVMQESILLCGQLVDAGSVLTWIGPAVVPYLGDATASHAIGSAACNALDGETEAAADAPIEANFPAFKISGFYCLLSAQPTNDVVISMRSAAAATTPAITCTVTGGADQSCSSTTGSTTDVATGATIALQFDYTEDLDLVDAWCKVYFAVK